MRVGAVARAPEPPLVPRLTSTLLGQRVTCPCATVQVCLLQHLSYATAARRTARCPCCHAKLRKGSADVWRLYAGQEEQDESTVDQQTRLEDLEHQRQVEVKTLEAAREREARAMAEIARLQARLCSW
jgi:hypothetical protein